MVFSSQEEILPTYRHYSNWFEALRNVGNSVFLPKSRAMTTPRLRAVPHALGSGMPFGELSLVKVW
jgi:hypothetical protein